MGIFRSLDAQLDMDISTYGKVPRWVPMKMFPMKMFLVHNLHIMTKFNTAQAIVTIKFLQSARCLQAFEISKFEKTQITKHFLVLQIVKCRKQQMVLKRDIT